jgi:DNA polymerase III subunit beta
MTISLNQDVLHRALQQVIGVVEANQTVPIVANVHISVGDNKLSVTATDLGIEITAIEPSAHTIDMETAFTLPGKTIFDICKSLPSDAGIEFTAKENKMIIQHGKSCKFTLATQPASEFPSIEVRDKVHSITIKQSELKNILQRTVFAMAYQDVRYYLNGMLLEITSSDLRSVATDGHRLACNSMEITEGSAHKIQCIVPRKASIELIKILKATDDTITLDIYNNFICLSNDNIIFKSKLIEGRFPEYSSVIPYDNDQEFTLNKEELKSILSRSAIMCDDKHQEVTLNIQKDKIIISSDNPGQKAAEQAINISHQNNEFSINFNIRYLIENLNIIKTDKITLKLSGQDKGMLITEVASPEDSTFLLMPLRL